jgi:hypothetical protein
MSNAHQTNQRTWAESQWIVATKATLPLTIPRSNSSRLHAIYPLCLSLIIRPKAQRLPRHKAVLAATKSKGGKNRRVLAWILA